MTPAGPEPWRSGPLHPGHGPSTQRPPRCVPPWTLRSRGSFVFGTFSLVTTRARPPHSPGPFSDEVPRSPGTAVPSRDRVCRLRQSSCQTTHWRGSSARWPAGREKDPLAAAIPRKALSRVPVLPVFANPRRGQPGCLCSQAPPRPRGLRGSLSQAETRKCPEGLPSDGSFQRDIC